MGLNGKLVKQVEIIAIGDVFHELFCKKQTDVSKMIPERVHGCDLHEGQWGDAGSIICWDYTRDGKRQFSKQIMEPDYENKTIKFTLLEGDLMEAFKTFVVTVHVDTHGLNNIVTWNAEYEKINEDIEDPLTLMDFFEGMTKDIEAHHVSLPQAATAVIH